MAPKRYYGKDSPHRSIFKNKEQNGKFRVYCAQRLPFFVVKAGEVSSGELLFIHKFAANAISSNNALVLFEIFWYNDLLE